MHSSPPINDSLPYPSGSPVRVRKLSACENPLFGPSSWADWVPGDLNAKSLPIDYELRGVLLGPIEIGEEIHVLRFYRNGIRADGLFRSTLVCWVEGSSIAVTFNSVYQILPDPELAEELKELGSITSGENPRHN